MTTTPQAALLSDKEINARIRASEVHEYHPGAILELVREIEQDILSKLKPPPSILTNNELIDLAVEHGLGRKMPPLGLNTGNVFYTDNSYRTAALFDFADAHEQALLAKLQATQEPVQAGWPPKVDELDDFLTWWGFHGQYIRAGGGDYEQCFAYAAWNYRAALAARKPSCQPDQADSDQQADLSIKAHKPLTDWLPLDIARLNSEEFDGAYWLAMKNGEVAIGEYEWMQGWNPHGFNLLDGGRVSAADVTHTAVFERPPHPASHGIGLEVKP